MRGAVGIVAMAALAVGCSSPLAPLRSAGGTDAAVDLASGHLGSTTVDAARDVGRGSAAGSDAAPDFGFLGHPDMRNSGGPCQSGAACISGFCVDGVCCNSACSGPCVTCSASGAIGTCFPLGAGAPARAGGCSAVSPAACGTTGLCDGVGGCALYATGTLCMRGACVDGTTVRAVSVCDGLGTCRPGPTMSCAPFTCSGGVCQADDCHQNPANCVSTNNRDASSD